MKGMNYIRIIAYDKDGTVVGVRTIEGAELNCTYFLDDCTGQPAAVSVTVRDLDEDGRLKLRPETAEDVGKREQLQRELSVAHAVLAKNSPKRK